MCRTFNRKVRILSIAFVALISSGCGRSLDLKAVGASQRPNSQNKTPALYLTHDFGKVRPSEICAHTFAVTNSSDRKWTVDHFYTSCRCTVGSVSSELVEPGQTLSIAVNYKAADKSVDVRKECALYFVEAAAPNVFFDLSAQVRSVITAEPAFAQVKRLATEQVESETFIVSDNSDGHSNELTATPDVNWISCTVVSLARNSLPDALSQKQWRVVATLDLTRLSVGSYHPKIRLRLGGADAESVYVPIETQIVPLVQVVPSVVFFGEVHENTPISKKILVRFNGNVPAPDPSQVHLVTDPDSGVRARWLSTTGSAWVLECELKIPSAFQDGIYKTEIRLDFSNKQVQPLIIPVNALQAEIVSTFSELAPT